MPKTPIDFSYDKICNSFLCDVIKAWFKLRNMDDEITDEVLWYNSKIKINKKKFCILNLGVIKVSTLYPT